MKEISTLSLVKICLFFLWFSMASDVGVGKDCFLAFCYMPAVLSVLFIHTGRSGPCCQHLTVLGTWHLPGVTWELISFIYSLFFLFFPSYEVLGLAYCSCWEIRPFLRCGKVQTSTKTLLRDI